MSIDGFIAGPNGEMDWMVWNWDDELKNYVMQLTDPVDTIILGRKLAEGFIPTWTSMLANPETADGFSKKMVETRKVVFTKTLDKSEWNETELAKGDLAEEIEKIKNQDGNDIIVYGGATFLSALIQARLIDEFHFFINPAALGSGMAIFKSLDTRQSLMLIKAKQFDCGITVLHYEPKNN